jgi:hypothetical protein
LDSDAQHAGAVFATSSPDFHIIVMPLGIGPRGRLRPMAPTAEALMEKVSRSGWTIP